MVTEAQKRASKKYFATHYKQIIVAAPKKEAENLEAVCKRHNFTKNGFIRQAIKEKIARDGFLAELEELEKEKKEETIE